MLRYIFLRGETFPFTKKIRPLSGGLGWLRPQRDPQRGNSIIKKKKKKKMNRKPLIPSDPIIYYKSEPVGDP